MARPSAFFPIAFAMAWALPGASIPERIVAPFEVPTDASPLVRPLPFFYDLYAFRGDGGMTDVVASFAVPAGNLDREEVDGAVRYRFNVTLMLADTARRLLSRSDDSVFLSIDHALAKSHLLYTHVETRAEPSMTTVQRVVMINAPNPGTGQLYMNGFEVPDFSGDALMLSDIALGLPNRLGGWKRGEVTLALLPSSRVPTDVFDVYYEVYNLPEGRPYRTEISIEPIADQDRSDGQLEQPIRVLFSGESAEAPGGALPELRRLETPLVDGRYRLTVTVTDEVSGNSARRDRLLVVRERGEGATVVAGCPIKYGVTRPNC